MALSLSKDGNISLFKTDPGLKNILIGLSWDEGSGSSKELFDGQLKSADGSVFHKGDNRMGHYDGDDKVIDVNLEQVPADIQKLVVTVTFPEAKSRQQNFGKAQNAFIRVTNNEVSNEIVRYDLTEDYSTETAMEFGEVYRHNGEWKFRVVGQVIPVD